MIVEAFVVVVLIWLIRGLIHVLSKSKELFDQAGSNESSREILRAKGQKAKEFICNNPNELLMSTEFREEKLKEYPSLVHIGDKLFRCKCLKETYDIQRNDFDVYSYFIHKDDSDIPYSEKHIRHLVYQYINSIGNDDFYDAFVEILKNDKDLLLSFIEECHVAESWRKECNKLYDPENYMKDFMAENDVEKRIHEINENVVIPADLRHRHPTTPSKPIKAYIDTQIEIAEKEIKLSQLAISGIPKLRGAGLLGILAVVTTVVWFIMVYNGFGTNTAPLWIVIILWFVFVFGSAFLCSDSDRAAYCQEEILRLIEQKSSLDMLSVWAQDYERERQVKIARERDKKFDEILLKSIRDRRELQERREKLRKGGNNNDRII